MLNKKFYNLPLLLASSVTMFSLSADTVKKETDIIMKDAGIEVTRAELENSVKYWPEKSRESAVDNEGARYQLLNQFMLNRKIAEEMKNITEESDPEFYWQREFAIRNLQNKLYLNRFREKLKVPDMTALAKEKLLVNREKYTASPEQRKASHILIKCMAGECERKEKRPLAEKVLKELKEGANFEAMVKKYSEDPGSVARNGSVKNWMFLGESRMDPYFVEGVYSIGKKGGYSDLVETQFGFHIIRLDDIKLVSYKADELVLPSIITTLEKQYKTLAERAFTATLTLSDKAFIDDTAVTGILVPYKAKTDTANLPKKNTVTIKKFIRE